MTILILEGREEQALSLGNALICEGKLKLCATGAAAQKAFGETCVDAAVLGFPVTDMDMMELLDWISVHCPKTKRMISTDFYSSFLMEGLQKRKVDLAVRAAWQVRSVCAHIRRLTGTEEMYPQERRWQQAANLLLNLGISESSRGFALLRRSILEESAPVISPEDRRAMADAIAAADSPFLPSLFPRGRETVQETLRILSGVLKEREALFSG